MGSLKNCIDYLEKIMLCCESSTARDRLVFWLTVPEGEIESIVLEVE